MNTDRLKDVYAEVVYFLTKTDDRIWEWQVRQAIARGNREDRCIEAVHRGFRRGKRMLKAFKEWRREEAGEGKIEDYGEHFGVTFWVAHDPAAAAHWKEWGVGFHVVSKKKNLRPGKRQEGFIPCWDEPMAIHLRDALDAANREAFRIQVSQFERIPEGEAG